MTCTLYVDDADDFGRPIRLRRTLFARRKRRKLGNVSDRKLQSFVEQVHLSSDGILHRGGRLARPPNPAPVTTGRLAHATRICGSTRMNPCPTASSNSLRNNPLGRSWGAWDGAALRIAPLISSASPGIGRKALLVTCHHNDSSNPSRSPGICAVAARVGISTTTTRTSPPQGSTRPNLLVVQTRLTWPMYSAAS